MPPGIIPRTAERLRRVTPQLEAANLLGQCQTGTFQPAERESILAVHEPQVFERARDDGRTGRRLSWIPTQLSARPRSRWRSNAAGACMAAVDAVVGGVDHTALCLVRPPGHHATPTRSMGFCLFNNIAVAAAHARDEHGLDRVLIVDWDVHHGNGTQDIFYADPTQFFLSIHRSGDGFYPGTGAADETGTGAGLGFTRNVPVRFGVSRTIISQPFGALEAAADKMKPELVLLSAGFDAHASIRLVRLAWSRKISQLLTTRRSGRSPAAHRQGRLVACLEGRLQRRCPGRIGTRTCWKSC